VGMFAAASGWWVCLAGGVTLLRRQLNPAMLVYVNQIAGVLLSVYGLLALARSVRM
jgi:arginine exporter protein ArgO